MKRIILVAIAGMLTASFGFAQASDAGANARFRLKFGRSAQAVEQPAAPEAAQAKEEAGMSGMKCMQDGGCSRMKGMSGMKGMSSMKGMSYV